MILRYTLTVEDVVDAARLHRWGRNELLQRIGFFVLALMGEIALFMEVRDELSITVVMFFAALTISLLVITFTPRQVFDPLVRRSARKSPMVGRPVELEITDEAIRWRSETTWDSPWRSFRRVKRSESVILLYFGPKTALNIPRRALSAEDAHELERLIDANVPNRLVRDSSPMPLRDMERSAESPELRYTLDASDWSAAVQLMYGRMPWIRALRWGGPLLAAFLCGVHAWKIQQGWLGGSFGDVAFSMVAYAATATVGFWFPRVMGISGRIAHSRTWLLAETALALDENGVTIQSTYGRNEYEWSTVTGWRENDRLITFFISPGGAIPIPKRAMNEQQRQRILEILGRRVPRH